MEYQGFTGSNYDEDDLERAKAGGGIYGFNRKPASESPTDINPDLKTTLMNEFNAKLDQIKSRNTNQRDQFDSLDQLRNVIMQRQKQIDQVNDEAAKNPLFSDDFKNNTQNHINEFYQKYPNFKQLDDQQVQDEQKFGSNPLHEQYMQEQQQIEELKKNPRFQNIINLLNK